MTASGTLAGVIDFREVCAGDLAAAWLLLPHGAASRCLAAYGTVDEATVARVKGWAIRTGLMLAHVGWNGDLGLPGGKPTWGPAGRATLERVAADS